MSTNEEEIASQSTAAANGSAESNDNRPTVDIGDPNVNVVGMDCIWHNMYAEAGFTTFRKWFSDDADAMLARVASHVEQNLYSIISLQLSKHSCVVVCASDKALADFPEDALIG